MKKTFFLLAIFLISVLQIQAASETVKIKTIDEGGSFYVYLTAESIPSQDTAVTTSFSIPKYDGVNWKVYPVNYTKLQSSTIAAPNITTTIEGSDDLTNWKVIDTVGVLGDSVETFQTGVLDFNSADSTTYINKFLYYRVRFIGLATNETDAYITLWLKFAKTEN